MITLIDGGSEGAFGTATKRKKNKGQRKDDSEVNVERDSGERERQPLETVPYTFDEIIKALVRPVSDKS